MAVHSKNKTPIEPPVEGITIHAPDQRMNTWWIRENLAARFGVRSDEVLTLLDPGCSDLMRRLTISNDGPMFSIQADNRDDITAIARWIARRSDAHDPTNWDFKVTIEPGTARLQRPDLQVPATFEALTRERGRVSGNHVPIEAVRRGDRQVVAASYPEGCILRADDDRTGFNFFDMLTYMLPNAEPVISLSSLADFPEVVSVIAATPVEARRPLPSIRELFVLSDVLLPDGPTLANLTNLETLFISQFSVCPGSREYKLELDAVPVTLRRLAVAARRLERLDALGRLTNLEELWLECDRHSLKAVGALTRLRSLHIGGESRASGWNALRHCVLLEDAFLGGLKANHLRAFCNWSKLRRLGISGRGLRSLAGIEAFAMLEELKLVMVTIRDLSPLRGHSRLNTLTLLGTKEIGDLEPLAELPRLRRLEIAQAGIEDRSILHIRSLRPLAGCESLETLTLHGTIVDDGDLVRLAKLPNLKRIKISFDHGTLAHAISSLRHARPDIELDYDFAKSYQGETVDHVTIHSPSEGVGTWWIRDDLTELLKASTNYAAEKKLRRALAAENPGLVKRFEFDTEGDAVVVHAKDENDIRSLARMINRLAVSSR